MRDFGHHIGEDTEIYFSLYDSCKQKFLTERFLVKISKEGFSNYIEKLHSNCTVFTVNIDILILSPIIYHFELDVLIWGRHTYGRLANHTK